MLLCTPLQWVLKSQLSSSHKKQTPRSLVQYLSLIARKRAKTAFLSKIFSFCSYITVSTLIMMLDTICKAEDRVVNKALAQSNYSVTQPSTDGYTLTSKAQGTL